MVNSIYSGTPVISVTDNRGIAIRTLNWNRTRAGDPASLLITHSLVSNDSLTVRARDPRLFTAWQAESSTAASLTTFSSLNGSPLRRDSTDSGREAMLSDAGGRAFWSRDPAGTVMQWVYDTLGRTQSSTRQRSGNPDTSTSAVLVYGDSDAQTINPQDDNLRGVCVRQYDEGGLLTTGSVALSGTVLSSSQTFLREADGLPDWPDDAAGRRTLLEETPYTTMLQADALGAAITQTDASGHAVSVTCDVSGVLLTQTLQLQGQSPVPLLTGMTMNAAGQILTAHTGNGVTTACRYEAATLRLSEIVATRDSDTTHLQSLKYLYDPVGNITHVDDSTVSTAWFSSQSTDGVRQFVYDALYQLIRASGRENAAHGAQDSHLPATGDQCVPYTRTYAYDDSGNLSTLTHTGAVNSTMNMVTQLTSNRSIRQDNNSSLTPAGVDWDSWFTPGGQLKTLQTEGGKPASGYTDATGPLTWDANNQLQTVTRVSRSEADAEQNDREIYQYREGIRVRKQTRTLTNAGSGLWTVSEVRYLPGLELRNTWQETVSNGVSSQSAYREQLEVVTTQAGRSQVRVLRWVKGLPAGLENNRIRYSLDDNIGSLQLELDETGQIISREEYYPFGGTAVWATRNETEAAYKTVRYSGKERDGTGLYYYGYRYYAPWLCRWTAADPAREVDGLNLFIMVHNNPVTQYDTGGLITTGAEARQRVMREFVTAAHMAPIESAAREKNAILSFRESGVYTIDALNNGAAAKGHNILEKTIKDKSVNAVYGQDSAQMLENAKNAGLIGLVGHWGGAAGAVSGIWVHNIEKAKDEIFALDLSRNEDLTRFRDNIAAKRIVPYTGDYDMHDIVSKSSGAAPAVGSEDETGIRHAINKNIAAVDPSRPFEATHMNAVRHGAQNNFVPYMWQEERHLVEQSQGYLGVVARPGPFPVAIVDGSDWTVVDTEAEWRHYFRSQKISQPEHWSAFPENIPGLHTGLRNTRPGYVLTPKHQHLLSRAASF
ncbi:RHS repeat-associated core domain-containing protein [Rahnella aquatilis]|uniref:RHS repeat-associated core domain-containing protein n=1 Tax=Rahnella aquatilis TaxID=34038 RepID=UPI003649CBA8